MPSPVFQGVATCFRLADRRNFLQSAAVATGMLCSPVAAQEKKRFAIAVHGGAGNRRGGQAAERGGVAGQGAGYWRGGAEEGRDEPGCGRAGNPLSRRTIRCSTRAKGRCSTRRRTRTGCLDHGRPHAKVAAAVAAVRTVRHPISLARLVMEQDAARAAGQRRGGEIRRRDGHKVERVENSWFDTDKRRQELGKGPQPMPKAGSQSVATRGSRAAHYGTVGCVALDTHGNLAAGTSTGGLHEQKIRPRRRFADRRRAARMPTTRPAPSAAPALGEQFIRHAVAYDISARMAYLKQPLKDAVSTVLRKSAQPRRRRPHRPRLPTARSSWISPPAGWPGRRRIRAAGGSEDWALTVTDL